MYLIATVMQGYFPDVFVKSSKSKDDIFSGKALLESLLQVSAGLFTRQMSSGPDWLAPQTVEVRNRRGHGERPSESDVLDSLRHMKFVFAKFEFPEQICAKFTFPEQHLEGLLKDAQRLVESARRQPGTIETIGVPRASFEKLVLLRALADFERRLEEQAGGFEFQNGTIRFQLPRHWGDQDSRSQRIKDQDPILRCIAKARHWLFHHTAWLDEHDNPTEAIDKVLQNMGDVLHALHGINGNTMQEENYDWTYHSKELCKGLEAAKTQTDARVPVAVALQLSSGQMTIPFPVDKMMVGRDNEIKEVDDALSAGPGARVLIHGVQGMGKDMLAARCAQDFVKKTDGLELQAWLQGSTDAALRAQLVDWFETHRPSDLREAGADQQKKLDAIKQWLATNDGWFMVIEDAHWDTHVLWECIVSPRTNGKGRLLVTSQDPLHQLQTGGGGNGIGTSPLPATKELELLPIATKDSLKLLRKMDLFGVNRSKNKRPPTFHPGAEDDEEVLKQLCKDTGGQVDYEAPSASEKSKDVRARRRRVLVRLYEHKQLGSDECKDFLERTLGNLPLVVQLCGHLLRSEHKWTTMQDLIDEFSKLTQEQLDQRGRNRMADTQLFGLDLSVKIAVGRIKSSAELSAREKGLAMALLAALAVLSPSETPVSLFDVSEPSELLGELGTEPPEDVHWAHHAASTSLLRGGEALAVARKVLEDYGLMKQAAASSVVVGIMHQLVQRSVRASLFQQVVPAFFCLPASSLPDLV